MHRVNFFTQKAAGGAAFRAQELRTEEQGANPSFSQYPGVPITAGPEVRIPKMCSAISLLLLVCLAVLPRMAAQDAPSAPAKTALFWKASSGTNVIYLLGSIHVGSKDMYPLPREVEDAFESSTELVVEVDINHLDKQKIQALFQEEGLYPSDDLLWNHVSKETRQNVEQFGSTYGIPTERLAKMKPWVVTMTTVTMAARKNGMVPELGIDQYFMDKADMAKDTKRVVGIESAEGQLKLLTGFADDVQEKVLAAALEDARMPERMKRIREAWLSGDADQVDKLISESSSRPEEVTKAVLEDRNLHMADVAEQFLNGKEQAFVVVGAAHLVGKDGVASILEKRGYRVDQVSLQK
jgi:uncharacterized protein